MVMYRNGVTSGMLVTRDDDPRTVVLASSKQRCSYLTEFPKEELESWGRPMASAAGSPEFGSPPEELDLEESELAALADFDLEGDLPEELGLAALDMGEAGEREPARPADRKARGSKRSLRRILIPLAAGLVLILATAKTTQVILEAPLKSEIQVNAAKKLADEENGQVEAERNANKIAALEQERSNFATKSVNLEAENSRLSSEIKKMAESIAVSQESRISTRSEMEALKAKVSKIEGENLALKKSNTELLAIQDGINKRLAQAEKFMPRVSMSMRALEVDSVKGKAVLEAVHSGDMAALKNLLGEEQYVNYRDDETGNTPLLVAASQGKMDAAKFLIEKGAYVNAVDREGQTPLMKAAVKGDMGMVELLLNKGADVRMSDMGGRTALYWALANKHDDIANLLRRF
jgi:hypothetical protein